MPEFTRYPRGTTRTLIDFNKLLASLENGGDVILCLPSALVRIIRMLLRDRAMWRTTYVIAHYEDGYDKPTVEEFEPVEEAISQFLGETNDMSTCSQLLSAIRDIASAIRTSTCCAPGGADYVSDGGTGVYYGTQAPVEKPTTFGEGQEFTTEAEFQEHLCQAANLIVEGIITSLNGWTMLTLALIIAGGLTVAFFVATPPLAIFIALATAGLVFGALHTLANYIGEHKEEWVCAIYNAGGYSAILAEVDDLLTTALVELGMDSYTETLVDMFHAMITTDVVNQAYTNMGLPTPITAVDCDVCAEYNCPPNVQVGQGDYVYPTEEDSRVWTSDDRGDGLRDILVSWPCQIAIRFDGWSNLGAAKAQAGYFNFQYESGGAWNGQPANWEPDTGLWYEVFGLYVGHNTFGEGNFTFDVTVKVPE